MLVQPAEEVVLHGAAAHGAFAVADDDDDVVASAFGADVAGEAAHVVNGAGFADDAPGECFAAVAFAQGAAFAGDRQRLQEGLSLVGEVDVAQQLGELFGAGQFEAGEAGAVVDNHAVGVDAEGFQRHAHGVAAFFEAAGRVEGFGAEGEHELARHDVVAFLVHALDLYGKRFGEAGVDVFGGGRGFGDFARAVKAAAEAVPEVAEEVVELFARFAEDEHDVLRAAAGSVGAGDVHHRVAFVVALQHGRRGEAVAAAIAFAHLQLVVDFPVDDFRDERQLGFARLRGDLHFDGAEVDHQRMWHGVVSRPGFAVKGGGVALLRREAVERVVKDDVAGDVAHARLLQALQHRQQLFFDEEGIATADDVEVAIDDAVGIGQAIDVKLGFPTEIRAEANQAGCGGQHFFHRGGVAQLFAVQIDQRHFRFYPLHPDADVFRRHLVFVQHFRNRCGQLLCLGEQAEPRTKQEKTNAHSALPSQRCQKSGYYRHPAEKRNRT